MHGHELLQREIIGRLDHVYVRDERQGAEREQNDNGTAISMKSPFFRKFVLYFVARFKELRNEPDNIGKELLYRC